MTDDQEERMLRMNVPKGTSRIVVNLHAADSKERLGTTYDIQVFEVSDLELAPKHTDEEYDEVWARLNDCNLEWAQLNKLVLQYEARIKELVQSKRVNEYEWKCKELKVALRNLDESEARIKELEAQAGACPICGTVRRVEELRAKEREKKPRRFPELDKIVPQNIDDKTEG